MSGLVLRRSLASTFVFLAASAFALAPARADTPPSVWDRASDPAAAASYRLHLEVQRRLALGQAAGENGFAASNEAQKMTVRAMLEGAHAEHSPDVRLRYDLGVVYLLLGADDPVYYKRAADVLRSALAEAPDHPLAESGWANLADACGHLGDNECERHSYTSLLALTTDEFAMGGPRRGTAVLNLAEAEMHLGHMKESIEGYREALRLGTRYPYDGLAQLALWGLSVALDRSGDRADADKEVLRVLEMDSFASGKSALLRDRLVFFYPDYEIHWYDGIGASALARKPSATIAEQARHWKEAEESFASYVAGAQRHATPEHADRWLDLAKLHYETAKAERERAEKKRGKLPPAPPPADVGETTL
jgi:tetratricopeptide (TPR) repeat protein